MNFKVREALDDRCYILGRNEIRKLVAKVAGVVERFNSEFKVLDCVSLLQKHLGQVTIYKGVIGLKPMVHGKFLNRG
jgi:hypothetical protein